MNDIEKRARELLAASYEQDGRDGMAESVRDGTQMLGLDDVAIRAIIAALTPPGGYVLVPKRATIEMLREGQAHKKDGTPVEDIYVAMLAARPEVSGG